MVAVREVQTGDGTTKIFTLDYYPISPMTEVNVNSSAQTEGTDFVVNYANKRITFSSAPGDGHAVEFIYNSTLGKTFEDVVNDVLYYVSTNQTEVTDFNVGSVVRTIIQAIAYEMGNDTENTYALYQMLDEVYTSGFIDDASGDDLDLLIAILGVTRNEATKATGTVTFSRVGAAAQDYPIAAGTIVSTQPSGTTPAIRFVTTGAVTLATGDTSIDATVEAETAGANSTVGSATIVLMVTAVTGVTSVTNSSATSGGADEESDNDLRARAKQAVDLQSKATVNAIEANVDDVDNIYYVKVDDEAQYEENEEILYDNMTAAYNLTYTSTGIQYIREVTGTAGASPYTFIQGTDYELNGSDQIEFQIGGTDPDNATDFYVDYVYDLSGGFNVVVAGEDETGLAVGDISSATTAMTNTKAAGISATLEEAAWKSVNVEVTPTIMTGYDSTAVKANVSAALSNYVDGLEIGDDVYVAKIYEIVMGVAGVQNTTITTPAADVTMYGGDKPYAGTITVN